jgi:hypothetical protein
MAAKNLGLIHDSYGTALANPSTTYVELPVPSGGGFLGVHIQWDDATSAATVTLESSNDPRAAATSTAAEDWGTESNVIVGPTATAAGSSSCNLGNIGMLRLRLKIVTTALTKLRIRANWRSS